MNSGQLAHHYYVDEAGDLTLFDSRGRIIVGKPGVSKVFMVGVAHVPNPKRVQQSLGNLRRDLLADPYFKDVPSMQPETKKTSLCFHAKDDLPEVRREVFKILPQFDSKVQVAIRRKFDLAVTAQDAYHRFGTKLSPNDIYDDLIKRLFKNLLHKTHENRIFIARRGKTARLDAIRGAINKAKKNFEATWKIRNTSQIRIHPAYPREYPGLQIIDYYLWALQRMYERTEDRFFNLIAPQFRLIMDLDDKRNKTYGEWYSDKNPLVMKKMQPVAG